MIYLELRSKGVALASDHAYFQWVTYNEVLAAHNEPPHDQHISRPGVVSTGHIQPDHQPPFVWSESGIQTVFPVRPPLMSSHGLSDAAFVVAKVSMASLTFTDRGLMFTSTDQLLASMEISVTQATFLQVRTCVSFNVWLHVFCVCADICGHLDRCC